MINPGVIPIPQADNVWQNTNGTPRTGTVTKGKTVGVNFIIKT